MGFSKLFWCLYLFSRMGNSYAQYFYIIKRKSVRHMSIDCAFWTTISYILYTATDIGYLFSKKIHIEYHNRYPLDTLGGITIAISWILVNFRIPPYILFALDAINYFWFIAETAQIFRRIPAMSMIILWDSIEGYSSIGILLDVLSAILLFFYRLTMLPSQENNSNYGNNNNINHINYMTGLSENNSTKLTLTPYDFVQDWFYILSTIITNIYPVYILFIPIVNKAKNSIRIATTVQRRDQEMVPLNSLRVP